MQDRRAWPLSVGLALALVLLAGVTAVSLAVTMRTNTSIDATRAEVVALSEVDDAIAGEAFAEAAYRRAPSARARARLEESVRGVEGALQMLRSRLGAADAPTLARVRQLNRRYVAEVETTLDTPRSALVDDRVAGPALDTMQRLLTAAIDSRRDELSRQTDQQAVVVRLLVVALVGTFALSFTAIAFVWRGLLRERRALRHAADTDALTGLRNRRGFETAVSRSLARPHSRCAIILVDLDEFKPVNDRHGHQTGDAVLVEAGRRLSAAARAGDVVARLGGDEFAVFLPRGRGVEHLAQRVLADLGAPYACDGLDLQVGASIGWASSPQDGDDLVGLVRSADEALYAAKAAGRNRVVSAAAHRTGAGV